MTLLTAALLANAQTPEYRMSLASALALPALLGVWTYREGFPTRPADDAPVMALRWQGTVGVRLCRASPFQLWEQTNGEAFRLRVTPPMMENQHYCTTIQPLTNRGHASLYFNQDDEPLDSHASTLTMGPVTQSLAVSVPYSVRQDDTPGLWLSLPPSLWPNPRGRTVLALNDSVPVRQAPGKNGQSGQGGHTSKAEGSSPRSSHTKAPPGGRFSASRKSTASGGSDGDPPDRPSSYSSTSSHQSEGEQALARLELAEDRDENLGERYSITHDDDETPEASSDTPPSGACALPEARTVPKSMLPPADQRTKASKASRRKLETQLKALWADGVHVFFRDSLSPLTCALAQLLSWQDLRELAELLDGAVPAPFLSGAFLTLPEIIASRYQNDRERALYELLMYGIKYPQQQGKDGFAHILKVLVKLLGEEGITLLLESMGRSRWFL